MVEATIFEQSFDRQVTFIIIIIIVLTISITYISVIYLQDKRKGPGDL